MQGLTQISNFCLATSVPQQQQQAPPTPLQPVASVNPATSATSGNSSNAFMFPATSTPAPNDGLKSKIYFLWCYIDFFKDSEVLETFLGVLLSKILQASLELALEMLLLKMPPSLQTLNLLSILVDLPTTLNHLWTYSSQKYSSNFVIRLHEEANFCYLAKWYTK